MSDRNIYTYCPLCNSSNHLVHYIADCSNYPNYDSRLSSRMVWKKCLDCGHIFTEGFFTYEAAKLIFSKAHDLQKVGTNLESNRFISAKIIEKVLPFASNGIWLDIGFGNGSLLFTAQEFGFEPIGLDLRKENVENLNNFGIKAFDKNITEVSIEPKCSVISMADVLEHIPYPRDALSSANRLLREGGCLFLSMPNTESILWQIMSDQNKNPYWAEMEHFHNFGRSRLFSLLEEFGFLPKRYGISERYKVGMEIIAIKSKSL
jgi:SAM-dependent methyltransferase